MDYTFRSCNDTDIPFLLELKEKSFRWYIETLYGWNEAVQTDIIKKELQVFIDEITKEIRTKEIRKIEQEQDGK